MGDGEQYDNGTMMMLANIRAHIQKQASKTDIQFFTLQHPIIYKMCWILNQMMKLYTREANHHPNINSYTVCIYSQPALDIQALKPFIYQQSSP